MVEAKHGGAEAGDFSEIMLAEWPMVEAKQGSGRFCAHLPLMLPGLNDGRSKTPKVDGWWFVTDCAGGVVNGRSKTRVGGKFWRPYTTHAPRLNDGRSKTPSWEAWWLLMGHAWESGQW